MASLEGRYPDNVPGPFYTDQQCIDCDICRDLAPTVFTRNDDGGYSYVYQQPTTPEELEQVREAIAGCCVDAIGDDGA